MLPRSVAIVAKTFRADRASRRRRRARPSVPLFTRPFVLLMLVQATFGYAFSSFFLLPKFLVTALGRGPTEIGRAMAAYGVTATICVPLMGAVVDRYGRRRFLTAGALLMAVASAAFVLVDDVGPLLYGLRAVQGVAFAMAFVAGVTLAVDVAPVERLGQAIGLIGLAMLSMHAIAPVAMELLAEHGSWDAGFIAAATGAFACAVVSRAVVDVHGTAAAHDAVPGLLSVLRDRRQVRIGGVVVLVGVAFGAMLTFHQPFAMELGIGRLRDFFVAYTVGALVIRVGCGTILDRLARHRIAIASLVLYTGVVTAMCWLAPGTLAVFGFGLGVAHGLFYPALNAVALEGAGARARGKVMALFQAGFSLGYTAGVFALGLVAARMGYVAVFALAGACPLAALVLLVVSPEGRAVGSRAAAVAVVEFPPRARSRATIGGCE